MSFFNVPYCFYLDRNYSLPSAPLTSSLASHSSSCDFYSYPIIFRIICSSFVFLFHKLVQCSISTNEQWFNYWISCGVSMSSALHWLHLGTDEYSQMIPIIILSFIKPVAIFFKKWKHGIKLSILSIKLSFCLWI